MKKKLLTIAMSLVLAQWSALRFRCLRRQPDQAAEPGKEKRTEQTGIHSTQHVSYNYFLPNTHKKQGGRSAHRNSLRPFFQHFCHAGA